VGQLTIYLSDEIESRLRESAKAGSISVSRLISKLIEEKTSVEWPKEVLELPGAWSDDFPSLEEIRAGLSADLKREEL
jgi:predicted transcriptional regulator